MIKNKKLMMALSFTLGTALLVSTAFADIMSTSGYEHLKQAIKYTSKSCSQDLENFTVQTSITLKNNDNVLFTSIQTDKYDNVSGATEHKSSSNYCNGITSINNSYSDKKCNIWYNSWNDTYQVYEYENERERTQFEDIFEDDEMKDVEKIIDAAVGNLKDYVIVENNADGSKEFSGSLADAQIPALVNAISSFAFKRAIPDLGVEMGKLFPKIQNDVYIKRVTGKATVNKDGILERIYGSGIMSGKDDTGTSHDLTLEVLIRIYDINSTVVTKPDLNGKNIERRYENSELDMLIDQKYIGKYKQDIVIVKDNAFTKIGERIIVIDNIDDKYVSGKYSETYKEEYAEYAKDKWEFDFNVVINENGMTQFEHIIDDNNTIIVNIVFISDTGGIYFHINPKTMHSLRKINFNSDFIRVFED
jgi:hypothetical protein